MTGPGFVSTLVLSKLAGCDNAGSIRVFLTATTSLPDAGFDFLAGLEEDAGAGVPRFQGSLLTPASSLERDWLMIRAVERSIVGQLMEAIESGLCWILRASCQR